jgi:hypothetical protein
MRTLMMVRLVLCRMPRLDSISASSPLNWHGLVDHELCGVLMGNCYKKVQELFNTDNPLMSGTIAILQPSTDSQVLRDLENDYGPTIWETPHYYLIKRGH